MRADSSISFIVLTSDEPWSDIWHTQLHYAHQLSKRTNVIFLGPPDPWRITNLFNISLKKNAISEHLVSITYFNWLPASLGKFALWVNDKINSSLLRKYITFPQKGQQGIVWHFDPHRSFFLYRDVSKIKHIFHVIDPIAGCNLDVPLAKSSDLIVVTSPRFTDYYKGLNKNVIQIGQGVDLDFYNESDDTNDEEVNVSKDSILLLGTISDQLHYTILSEIALKYPGKLVLIGPDKTITESGKSKFRSLLGINGVTWLGPMPPLKFRKHLRACKLGLIAYDNSINEKNDFRSPLKVIGYLATGKCIVSNIDCEVGGLINKAIFNVNTKEEYFDMIDKSYNDELLFDKGEVNDFLKSIDYNYLINRILNKLL